MEKLFDEIPLDYHDRNDYHLFGDGRVGGHGLPLVADEYVNVNNVDDARLLNCSAMYHGHVNAATPLHHRASNDAMYHGHVNISSLLNRLELGHVNGNGHGSVASPFHHHSHGDAVELGRANGNLNAHGYINNVPLASPLCLSPEWSSSSRSVSPENIRTVDKLRLLNSFRSLNLGRAPATPPTLPSYNYYTSNVSSASSPAGRFVGDMEVFGVEDSLILQPRQDYRRNSANAIDYRFEIEGSIYQLAKDQDGCRYLQKKFELGRHMVDDIFSGLIGHVAELMVNPFGNYLMQKLFEVCSEEQRMAIILALTKDPAKLVKICVNIHGTRSVQKLIDTLETRQQVVLVVSALKPGILELIKDLNGSHVLQHCLSSLPLEDNKFIFDAAVRYCVAIATHRHGCCVLQRCIDYSRGEYRAKLVAEVCKNGLRLAQDAFGNYVVQFVLDLKDPVATANLMSRFQGSFVNLSTQKFSSNVVEKCLKVSDEQDKARIIAELLAVPHFDQLLQDPYANYVIQSALENSKGALHKALTDAIRPHATALRTNLHCKRIFSRALLRK